MDSSAFSVTQEMLDSADLPKLTLGQIKYVRVYQALRDNEFNRTHAAKELDISTGQMREFVLGFRHAGIYIANRATPAEKAVCDFVERNTKKR